MSTEVLNTKNQKMCKNCDLLKSFHDVPLFDSMF